MFSTKKKRKGNGIIFNYHLWYQNARSHWLSLFGGRKHFLPILIAIDWISSSNFSMWVASFSKCKSPFSSTTLASLNRHWRMKLIKNEPFWICTCVLKKIGKRCRNLRPYSTSTFRHHEFHHQKIPWLPLNKELRRQNWSKFFSWN